MPSATHDGLVTLFTNDPTLAARLLQARADAPRLPAYDEVTPTRGDLGPPVPSDRRVDLALEHRRSRRRVGITLLEVQLTPDPDKGWTWPNYYAAARDRWRCPVLLIIITRTRAMARWCRRTITSEQMTFTPIVLGPDEIPAIIDPRTTRAHPELGVLSALIHGTPDGPVVAAARAGLERLDIDTSRTYNDLIRSVTGSTEQPMMTSQEYLARHGDHPVVGAFIDTFGVEAGLDAYDKFFWAEHRILKARRAANLKAHQDLILETLAARGIRIPRPVRAAIRACTDERRLFTIQRRAYRVRDAADVLTRKRLPTAG